jgi:hypothetical protein
LQALTGYKPRIALDEGIARLCTGSGSTTLLIDALNDVTTDSPSCPVVEVEPGVQRWTTLSSTYFCFVRTL